jgi:hypothetical protein
MTPVAPFIEHVAAEMMLEGGEMGVEVIVHEVSVGAKPVPDTVIVVPANDPSAGDPAVGLTEMAGVTVNVCFAESPCRPVTITV